jgi:DNA repair photolyase
VSLIYEPKGKAREYSPLAINLYTGCGHKCSYCYVPKVLRIDKSDFDNNVNSRKDVINKLKKELPKHKNSDLQVFMSFTTDPYNPIDAELKLTREALKLFLEYQIPVSILTKSGLKALRDLDIIQKFGSHIKIGASLTYDNDIDSSRVENGAALPQERLEMLKVFHESGVRTWTSFEPIISPTQTLNMINRAIEFTDEFQLGKLADDKRVIDWERFLEDAVNILRTNKKEFYIKETLRKTASNVLLELKEYEMDYLTLKPFSK